MHCFYQFLLMSSIFTRILSLAHLFYAYFTHGPNKSASAQYDNTRGAWLTQEGCTITERKEGRVPYRRMNNSVHHAHACIGSTRGQRDPLQLAERDDAGILPAVADVPGRATLHHL